MTHMMFFGFGFCAAALAPRLQAQNWQLSASCRTPEKAAQLQARNIRPIIWPEAGALLSADALTGVSHALISAPPNDAGDPTLASAGEALASIAGDLQWLGYLSTTGVYGDHGGAWIDEDTPAGTIGARGQKRVNAETQWRAFSEAQCRDPMAGFF